MITTTLNAIRNHQPCTEGWKTLLGHLGKTEADDEPLPFSVILKSNGLDDALWCCRAAPEYDKEWRLFAVWCARKVQHLMTDQRSIAALDVAERFANGQATEEELSAAAVAARAAARDAKAAAKAAALAAWVSVEDAASEAAWVAEAAALAAWVSVEAAARDAQTEEFLRIVGGSK